MIRWVLIPLFLLNPSAQALDAVYGSDGAMPVGVEVRFESYSQKTRSYKFISARLPGEGEWDASTEAVARSIKEYTLEELKKNPHQIVKKKLPLIKPLTILSDEELAARAKWPAQ